MSVCAECVRCQPAGLAGFSAGEVPAPTPFRFLYRDGSGPVNLTGWSATVQLRRGWYEPVVERALPVGTGAADGIVYVVWQPGDHPEPGWYHVQVWVTDGGGTVLSSGRRSYKVAPSLAPAP